MSTTTTNYGLIKPDTTDPILVGQLNDNADVIDATLKSLSDALDVAKLGIKYKGEVNYYSNLPSSGNQIGDAYTVKYAGSSGTTPDGTEYVWGTVSGTNQWINFSKDSYTKAEVDALLAIKQNALTTAQLAAVNSGIDSTKVAQIETNKTNISLVAKNGVANKFNFNAWKNVGVDGGTVTILSNGLTITATNDNCWTYFYGTGTYQYPINARIPVTAGGTYVFTWNYTANNSQANDKFFVFADGNIDVRKETLSTSEYIEYTVPTGTTFLTFRVGVQTAGNSASYSNIMCIPKSLYIGGVTDYQPYAMTNAELTAAIQALQAQIANQ